MFYISHSKNIDMERFIDINLSNVYFYQFVINLNYNVLIFKSTSSLSLWKIEIELEQSITRVIIVLCRMLHSNIYTYVSHFLGI